MSLHSSGERGRKEHKPKEGNTNTTTQEALASSPPFSFLFVVNELDILEGDAGNHPNADKYGNPTPPSRSRGYGPEKPGEVWRYSNGSITPAAAEGFYWCRPKAGAAGSIHGQFSSSSSSGGNGLEHRPLEVYKTYSVFNCWRFLPCLYADVDVTTVREMEVDDRWFALEFSQDVAEPGTTRIDGCGGRQRHAAGTRPSWIPGLLPTTYAAPPSSPRSTGLGGCLPLIIALLALSKRPGHCDDVFRDGSFEGYRWRGERHHRADPPPTGPVRGVMVQICFDTDNTYTSTFDSIREFEERGKFIVD